MILADAFNRVAGRYYLDRRRLVPCFEAFYGTAVGALKHRRDAAIDVLDLGAGTGLLSRFVLDAFPNARLTIVDIAEDMLARAKERFAGLSGTVEVRAMDHASEPLEGGPFDAVVSALSVHHLTDEGKRGLVARIHAALRPGGVFVNADQVLGATPALQSQYRED